jgi:tRNA A-37 threonylcarbamoyl transferase component Bud32
MLNLSQLNLGVLQPASEIKLDDGSQFSLHEIVRVLPNARVVARGILNGNIAYAKFFIGLRANIHASREASGTKHLNKASILTPNLLLETSYQNQPVIVYKAIENALNAEDFMRKNDFLTRQEMAKKLAQTVAIHHSANLLQTDIHLKNFLIAKNEADSVYTIDGDGIIQANNKSQKQHNLATFFSKFDALDDDFMQESFEAYCETLGVQYNYDVFTKIYFLTQKIRQKTASDYADKKVFRSCTDVKIIENTQQFLAISRHFNIENQSLNDLDAFLNTPDKNIKNGNTCTIGLAEIAGKQVVIKRYNIKSFWHSVKLAIKQSRAAKSWANAHRLQIYNIATPQPLAFLEEKNGINSKSYFLSEFVDAPDIAEFFASEKNTEIKQSVAYEVSRLFYKMSLLRIVHGDCKASNIKIKDGKPILLDLDSLFVIKNLFPYTYQHVKDLKRFMQNWQNDAETTQVLKNAFKLCYEVEDDHLAVPNALDQAGIV